MDEQPNQDLIGSIASLRDEVKKLNEQRFFSAHNSWLGLIWFNLVRGLTFGLGSVLGATMLVYLLALMLSHIDFIPILGEWAHRISEIIQAK